MGIVRLFRTEVRRIAARGVMRVLIAFAVIGIAVTGVAVLAFSKTQATIDQQTHDAVEASKTAYAQQVSTCVTQTRKLHPPQSTTTADPTTPVPAPPESGAGGDEWTPVYQGTATPELLERYCLAQMGLTGRDPTRSGRPRDTVFQLTRLWVDETEPSTQPDGSPTGPTGVESSLLVVIAPLLFIGALIAGASFIGSEWQAGSLVVFLTWEPRRVRVLLVKLLALATLAALTAFALQALFGVALIPTALIKGSTEGVDAHWSIQLVLAMARISAITAMGATIGGALAMIGRRTALAVGGVFLWVAVGETIINGLKPAWQPWLLAVNATGVLTAKDMVHRTFTPEGFETTVRAPMTAGVELLVVTAIVVSVAAFVFRRRDFATA